MTLVTDRRVNLIANYYGELMSGSPVTPPDQA